MGILKFFRRLSIKYPNCLIHLNGTYTKCESVESKGINLDCLGIDLNSEFHPIAQDLYQYGNGTKQPSFIRKKNLINISENKYFEEICKRIEQLRKIMNPKKEIYLAIDGVAGSSKLLQMKKRRFKSIQSSLPSNGFDSNQISCGTLMMDRLGQYIDTFVQDQIKNNPNWKNLKVILSTSHVYGEGEHKLLAYMRANPSLKYTVVSPDADLIFLGLGLHNPNVYIFRKNIFDDIAASFFLVDLNKFRECIISEIKYKTNDLYSQDTNTIIDDFTCICLLIGDDFLPQINSINISNDGIEKLILSYNSIINSNGFITCKDKNDNYTFNPIALKSYFKYMASIEKDMIINNYKFTKTQWPDTILIKYISYDQNESKERTISLDFDKYKSEYYESKFNKIEPRTICHEYIKGMIFIIRYYLKEIPSFDWYYPFCYAPFFADLAKHIDTFNFELEFPPSTPFSQLEQLIAVLPGKSAYLLPSPLQFLSTSLSSPIIDMFPIDFESDYDGKKYEYEATVLLPVSDPDRIRTIFKEVECLLSEEDQKRNKNGNILIYN
jgi:5'-3' exonuclease